MFSINIYLRFALMVVLIGGGIALSVIYGFWYGFPFWLVGLFLLVGYVALGTVQSAAQIMQTGDVDAAERRLKLTLTPKLLYVTNRAYYYMLKGTIAMQRKQIEEAEKWFRKARELELPTDNEKAMILLQLAGVAAQRHKWNQARIYLRDIKKLKVTEEELKRQIKEFEKALASSGQLKAATRSGMAHKGGLRQPGGKRRRPRMK
ncbi:MAG: hypothetical protein D6818_03560 [Bacteroidetes bacterium]|nr:MAG: hypothetical protein D6818_03560 [Bacteroidota bacterium]